MERTTPDFPPKNTKIQVEQDLEKMWKWSYCFEGSTLYSILDRYLLNLLQQERFHQALEQKISVRSYQYQRVPAPHTGAVQWVCQPSGGQWCSTVFKVPDTFFAARFAFSFFFFFFIPVVVATFCQLFGTCFTMCERLEIEPRLHLETEKKI